jgi:hypothetical protein
VVVAVVAVIVVDLIADQVVNADVVVAVVAVIVVVLIADLAVNADVVEVLNTTVITKKLIAEEEFCLKI